MKIKEPLGHVETISNVLRSHALRVVGNHIDSRLFLTY